MKYQLDEAPKDVLALADRLVPLLIQGEHPALAALRQQLPQARVSQVELTGCGFYIRFEVPSDVALTEPADFAGGSATIRFAGAEYPAGCVLFVRGGRLATLEVYTYAGNHWPADAVVASIEDVVPVFPERPIPSDRREFLTEEHRPGVAIPLYVERVNRRIVQCGGCQSFVGRASLFVVFPDETGDRAGSRQRQLDPTRGIRELYRSNIFRPRIALGPVLGSAEPR